MHECACIRVLAVAVSAAGESIQGGGEGGLLAAGNGVEEGVALEGVKGVLTLGLHKRLQQEEKRSITSDKPAQDRPCV